LKKTGEFIKLTIMGGLLVLLPVLLFVLLLIEIVELVVGLATPIADLFPRAIFEEINHPVLIALLLLTGASFFIGLAMKSKVMKAFGTWLEEKTLNKVPIYKFVKALVAGFTSSDETSHFRPALLKKENGIREIVYVVEDLGNGDVSIMQPHAPTGMSGPVMIVPRDSVELLDAGFGDVNLVITHMGLGAGGILKKKETTG